MDRPILGAGEVFRDTGHFTPWTIRHLDDLPHSDDSPRRRWVSCV